MPYKSNPGKPPRRGTKDFEKWNEAAAKFKAFHWGDEPEGLKEVRIAKPPKFGFAIGEVVSIAYETTKNGEKAVWEHEFGEEGGKRPTLVADSDNHRLHFVGGDYTVEARGIVD